MNMFLLTHSVAAGQAIPRVKVAQDNGVAMYMDKTSITNNGPHATADMLMDLNNNDNGFYSATQTVGFACKDKNIRLLAHKAYAEKMGGGELVAEIKSPANGNLLNQVRTRFGLGRHLAACLPKTVRL